MKSKLRGPRLLENYAISVQVGSIVEENRHTRRWTDMRAHNAFFICIRLNMHKMIENAGNFISFIHSLCIYVDL